MSTLEDTSGRYAVLVFDAASDYRCGNVTLDELRRTLHEARDHVTPEKRQEILRRFGLNLKIS